MVPPQKWWVRKSEWTLFEKQKKKIVNEKLASCLTSSRIGDLTLALQAFRNTMFLAEFLQLANLGSVWETKEATPW